MGGGGGGGGGGGDVVRQICLVIRLQFSLRTIHMVCQLTCCREGCKRVLGGVVRALPPTSKVCGSNSRTYKGKLVVAYQRLADYSAESYQLLCTGFLCP